MEPREELQFLLNKQRKMTSTKLRVATWNILADSLCTDYDQGFPFSSPEERDPHRRARLQYQILSRQKADVIALQEVDSIDRLQPFLESMGYAVQYVQRKTRFARNCSCGKERLTTVLL